MLQHQKDRVWHDIVSFDESWFYFTTDHERIWLAEGIEAPEGGDHCSVEKNDGDNCLDSYRVLPDCPLPKGMKFNGGYYISYILDPRASWRRSQVGGSDRRLHVHTDDARPHTAKKATEFLAGNGMKKAPIPPDSPDLAPCDSYTCGHIKARLACESFAEPDKFLQAIDAIFSPLKKPHWNACFRSGWTDWRNLVWQLVV
jgi:hypothetical protein